MPMPAARMTDLHACAMTSGAPAGPILPPCAVTVLTGSLPQARMGDLVTCVPPPGPPIAFGSPTVLVCGQPAARLLDPTACGGMIVVPGCVTVLIGP